MPHLAPLMSRLAPGLLICRTWHDNMGDQIALLCAVLTAVAGACWGAPCVCGGVHGAAAGGRGGRGPKFPHLCARCDNSLRLSLATSLFQM